MPSFEKTSNANFTTSGSASSSMGTPNSQNRQNDGVTSPQNTNISLGSPLLSSNGSYISLDDITPYSLSEIPSISSECVRALRQSVSNNSLAGNNLTQDGYTVLRNLVPVKNLFQSPSLRSMNLSNDIDMDEAEPRNAQNHQRQDMPTTRSSENNDPNVRGTGRSSTDARRIGQSETGNMSRISCAPRSQNLDRISCTSESRNFNRNLCIPKSPKSPPPKVISEELSNFANTLKGSKKGKRDLTLMNSTLQKISIKSKYEENFENMPIIFLSKGIQKLFKFIKDNGMRGLTDHSKSRRGTVLLFIHNITSDTEWMGKLEKSKSSPMYYTKIIRFLQDNLILEYNANNAKFYPKPQKWSRLTSQDKRNLGCQWRAGKCLISMDLSEIISTLDSEISLTQMPLLNGKYYPNADPNRIRAYYLMMQFPNLEYAVEYIPSNDDTSLDNYQRWVIGLREVDPKKWELMIKAIPNVKREICNAIKDYEIFFASKSFDEKDEDHFKREEILCTKIRFLIATIGGAKSYYSGETPAGLAYHLKDRRSPDGYGWCPAMKKARKIKEIRKKTICYENNYVQKEKIVDELIFDSDSSSSGSTVSSSESTTSYLTDSPINGCNVSSCSSNVNPSSDFSSSSQKALDNTFNFAPKLANTSNVPPLPLPLPISQDSTNENVSRLQQEVEELKRALKESEYLCKQKRLHDARLEREETSQMEEAIRRSRDDQTNYSYLTTSSRSECSTHPPSARPSRKRGRSRSRSEFSTRSSSARPSNKRRRSRSRSECSTRSSSARPSNKRRRSRSRSECSTRSSSARPLNKRRRSRSRSECSKHPPSARPIPSKKEDNSSPGSEYSTHSSPACPSSCTNEQSSSPESVYSKHSSSTRSISNSARIMVMDKNSNPKHPKLEKFDPESIRQFCKKYDLYKRKVEISRKNGNDVRLVTFRDCMTHERLEAFVLSFPGKLGAPKKVVAGQVMYDTNVTAEMPSELHIKDFLYKEITEATPAKLASTLEDISNVEMKTDASHWVERFAPWAMKFNKIDPELINQLKSKDVILKVLATVRPKSWSESLIAKIKTTNDPFFVAAKKEAPNDALKATLSFVKDQLKQIMKQFEMAGNIFGEPSNKRKRKSENSSNKKHRKNDDSKTKSDSAKKPCKFYAQGKCKYGDKCRFSHAKTSGVTKDNDKSKQKSKQQICYDFVKGICKKGDKCKYSHSKARLRKLTVSLAKRTSKKAGSKSTSEKAAPSTTTSSEGNANLSLRRIQTIAANAASFGNEPQLRSLMLENKSQYEYFLRNLNVNNSSSPEASFTWKNHDSSEYQNIIQNLTKCVKGTHFSIPSSKDLLQQSRKESGNYFPMLIGGDSAKTATTAIQAYVDSGATHTFINEPAVNQILKYQDPNNPALILHDAPATLSCRISADGSLGTPIKRIGILHARCLWQEGHFLMLCQPVLVIPGKTPIIVLGQDAQQSWGISCPGAQLAKIIDDKVNGPSDIRREHELKSLVPATKQNSTTTVNTHGAETTTSKKVRFKNISSKSVSPHGAVTNNEISNLKYNDGVAMFGECLPNSHSSINMAMIPTQRDNFITKQALLSCRPGTFDVIQTPVATVTFDAKYFDLIGKTQELECSGEAASDVRIVLKNGETSVYKQVIFKIITNAPNKACIVGAEISQQTDETQDWGYTFPCVDFPSREEHDQIVKDQVETLLVKAYDNIAHFMDQFKDQQEYNDFCKEVRDTVYKAMDDGTFAAALQPGPPISVPPQRIYPKKDATPPPYPGIRVKDPYALKMQKLYLDRLMEGGLIELLPDDADADKVWLSAPNMVRKPGPPRKNPLDDWRMTVDEIQVNKRTVRTAAPHVDMREMWLYLRGSSCYSKFDKTSGFFQLALHPESRNMFCMLTRWGIYRWKRVTQGGVNSVAYYQSAMTEIFHDLLYIPTNGMVNIMDDFLLYNVTLRDQLESIKRFFARCKMYNIKLAPKKTNLFASSIEFCGRQVSKKGLQVSPSRIKALTTMGDLTTGADVMQLICGMRWFSDHIPKFAEISSPLQKWLTAAMKDAKKKTKRNAKKILLIPTNGWSPALQEVVKTLVQSTADAILLSHCDYTMVKCAHTDASEEYWCIIITQCHASELKKPRHLQKHQILAAISGAFTGSQLNWSMVDKEQFPILKIMDYDHFAPDGTWYIFTDAGVVVAMHRMLNSTGIPVGKAARTRRYRWLAMLSLYNIITVHVAGIENWIPDLLTRAGAPSDPIWQGPKLLALRLEAPESSTTLAHNEFNMSHSSHHFPCTKVLPNEWPNLTDIQSSQKSLSPLLTKKFNLHLDSDTGVYTTKDNKIWIPTEDNNLWNRIIAVSHQASAGHRGVQATLDNINHKFSGEHVPARVKKVLRNCLQCIKMYNIKDGIIPRPFGSTLIAQKPGEVAYADYIWIYDSYVLVIVDAYTRFIWLFPTNNATAAVMAKALVSIYDILQFQYLITDQGSHFDNKVCKYVAEALNINKSFTPCYMPWSNPAERVNRELCTILPKLRSEFKIPEHEWHTLLPLIKYSLNTTFRDILQMTPAEALTGIKQRRTSQFCCVYGEGKKIKTIKIDAIKLDFVKETLKEYRRELHDARNNIFRRTKERHIANNNKRKRKHPPILPRIEKGDYVLVATRPAGNELLRSNKIRVKWQGPMVVIKTITKWLIEVQFLGKENSDDEPLEVHVNRVRRYSDKLLNLTEDIIECSNDDASNMVPKAILSWKIIPQGRVSNVRKVHLLIQWRGYPDPQDYTWEPALRFAEDCRVMVKKYLEPIMKQKGNQILSKVYNQIVRTNSTSRKRKKY